MDHHIDCQLLTVPTYGLCTCDFDQRMMKTSRNQVVYTDFRSVHGPHKNNQTLMCDDRPVRLKFGYDHMIETREIEAGLRMQGITGTALHFAVISEMEVRHKDDLPYRERQRLARLNGETWAGGGPALPTDADILRAALEAIRDGHNDPSGLATDVLEKLK